MFHVTLLICAYFKTVSYYFCVQALKVLETGELLTCFILFLGFSRFLFCVSSLSLNLESRKNASWKDCHLEKKPNRKNAYSTFGISVISPMKINPQHYEQTSFQPQTVYHFRSI